MFTVLGLHCLNLLWALEPILPHFLGSYFLNIGSLLFLWLYPLVISVAKLAESCGVVKFFFRKSSHVEGLLMSRYCYTMIL